MPRKNRPSKPVIEASFDVLTFTNQSQMRFTGPFMSARQHPQWWKLTVTCEAQVAGERICENLVMVPPEKMTLAGIAPFVKANIHALGFKLLYRLEVTARVIDVAEARRHLQILQAIPPEVDPYKVET